MYPKCTLFDDNRHNFGNTVSQLSMLIHQSCIMLIINMNILMKSVDWALNVTQAASFGKLRLYLIPIYAIYAFLLSRADFSHSSHVLPLPSVPCKNATKFVRKDLPFVKLA